MPFVEPMPKTISTEVPFVEVDGRRALTRKQLVEHPELAEFVRLFPNSFEQSMMWDCMFFIEPKVH